MKYFTAFTLILCALFSLMVYQASSWETSGDFVGVTADSLVVNDWARIDSINVDDIVATGNIEGATYGSDGTVTNAELLFIKGLTSDAQTQFNNKQDAITISDGGSPLSVMPTYIDFNGTQFATTDANTADSIEVLITTISGVTGANEDDLSDDDLDAIGNVAALTESKGDFLWYTTSWGVLSAPTAAVRYLSVGADSAITWVNDVTLDSLNMRTGVATGNLEAATYGSDGTVTDAELLYLDATSSIQTQINSKQATIISTTDLLMDSLNAGPIVSTGNIEAATYGSDGGVTNAELLFLDATSSVQTQLNAKQATIAGSTDILMDSLNAGPIVSTGNIEGATYGSNGTVTNAELLYLSSATDTIQKQIDTKQATLTGSVDITVDSVTAVDAVITDDVDITDNLTVGDIVVDEAAGVINFTGATSAALSATGDLTISTTANNKVINITPHGEGDVNITNVDIGSGYIDGTTIGNTSALIGIFTDLTSTGTFAQTVGSNVASASTITLGAGNGFIITGTNDVDSIDTASPQANGTIIYLMFTQNAATNGVVDGTNIKIAGNFAYAGGTNDGDVLTLIRINDAFYEITRSSN